METKNIDVACGSHKWTSQCWHCMLTGHIGPIYELTMLMLHANVACGVDPTMRTWHMDLTFVSYNTDMAYGTHLISLTLMMIYIFKICFDNPTLRMLILINFSDLNFFKKFADFIIIKWSKNGLPLTSLTLMIIKWIFFKNISKFIWCDFITVKWSKKGFR